MTESVVNTPHNPVTTYSIDSNGDVVTDSSGNPAGNIKTPVTINPNDGNTTLVTLTGGQHAFMAVTAGSSYKIESDVDVFVKASPAAAIVGMGCDAGDSIHTGGVDMSTYSELDFSTDSISVEFWCVQEDTDNASGNMPLAMGQGSGAALLDITMGPKTSGTTWIIMTRLRSAGGTVIHESPSATTLTGIEEGSMLRHCVVIFDRSNDQVLTYVDATLVDTEAFSDGGAGNVTLNQNPSQICLGGALNNNARLTGALYDMRLYNTILTLPQIQARNALGPVPDAQMVNDVPTSTNYKWGIDFQDQADWTASTEPEVTQGNGLFDTAVATPTITETISGGLLAATSNSPKILAGVPEVVGIGAGNTYLNLYSLASASGEVRITNL